MIEKYVNVKIVMYPEEDMIDKFCQICYKNYIDKKDFKK